MVFTHLKSSSIATGSAQAGRYTGNRTSTDRKTMSFQIMIGKLAYPGEPQTSDAMVRSVRPAVEWWSRIDDL